MIFLQLNLNCFVMKMESSATFDSNDSDEGRGTEHSGQRLTFDLAIFINGKFGG